MAPKRKSTKPKPHRKPQYSIVKLNGVACAEAISSLLIEGFGPDAGGRPTVFIGTTFWGAYEKGTGKLVGVAGMVHSAIEVDSFYLNRSYVLPEHRGHGLQRRLIKARVDRAREMGGKTCTSDTYNVPASTNNLIACGFRAYAPEQPWRSGDDGVVYWRLALGPKRPRRLVL